MRIQVRQSQWQRPGQRGRGCILIVIPAAVLNRRASYSDGKPVPAVAGGSCEPEPCAGVPGTQITVEDVFYNMPTRRKAFRSPSEEYNRILDVVTRYAVHCGDRGVAFTCRKHGSASPDVHSPASSDRRAVVRHLYGAALAKELLNVSGGPGLEAAGGGSEVATGAPVAASSSSSSSGADDGGAARFTFNGLLSNANYSMKRRVFILFINGRSATGAASALDPLLPTAPWRSPARAHLPLSPSPPQAGGVPLDPEERGGRLRRVPAQGHAPLGVPAARHARRRH